MEAIPVAVQRVQMPRRWGACPTALALPLTWLLAAGGADTLRDALRTIVQRQCLPHFLATQDPAPSLKVEIESAGGDGGFALLHDRKGGAHFLLIPTRTVKGLDAQDVLQPQSPNYFAAAWHARVALSEETAREIRRGAVGLGINPLRARSQDQLHIRIECLQPTLYDALRCAAAGIGKEWSAVTLDGRAYLALRIMGESLEGVNPLVLLAGEFRNTTDSLDQFSVLLAGMECREGPGFVLLAQPRGRATD